MRLEKCCIFFFYTSLTGQNNSFKIQLYRHFFKKNLSSGSSLQHMLSKMHPLSCLLFREQTLSLKLGCCA